MTFVDQIMEFLIFLGLLVIGVPILVMAIWCAFTYLDCRGFSNGTGMEARWSWGCYANVDGKWVPKEYVYGNANEIRFKEKK